MQKKKKQILRAWILYDWASSAFATTIMAAILPIFFRDAASTTLRGDESLATSIWGYTISLSMFLIVLFSLTLGPMADFYAKKKRFLFGFFLLGVLSTALLTLTGIGDWIWVALLYLLASIGYAGSELFYDSLLPHIVSGEEIHSLSTRAYAWGYVGGGLLLAFNLMLIFKLPQTTLPNGETIGLLGMRLSFLCVAVWWGVFGIPLFRWVPEPPAIESGTHPPAPLKIAIERLSQTFHSIRRYRSLFLFIAAFWFYNDGINTIILMAAAFGNEIGIGTLHLIGALLLTQALGFPCSLLFGRAALRFGAKRVILIGLSVYLFVSLGGFFMQNALHFWILAFLVGLVQGGTQGLSRSLFGTMIPKNRTAEFFSFYNISGRLAGIMGPAIFGLASQLAGSSRFGVLSLMFFFLTGGLLLQLVDVDQGKRIASEY